MKKIIFPGIVAGLATAIASMLLGLLTMRIPAVSADYANAATIRPWNDPLMSLYFLYPFVLGLIMAWAWNKSKSLFSGSTAARGTKFGLAIFLVTSIPGMLITYACFPLSIMTIFAWTLDGLVVCLVTGLIVARMNRGV